MFSSTNLIITAALAIILLSSPAYAFGAGNIPGIARVEGHNFRHGDIEDTLKTLVFLGGSKWTGKLIKRVYFGNWLRDYSQAVDVGTVKNVPAQTIRVLVWLLSFMSFGFATGEFEVTDDRLGVYRPEEHIDNPKDYADNEDARLYDARLRPPVHPIELAVDPATCMKNYIANESLGIATSTGYIKHSLNRSIHFGRLYTSGPPGDLKNEAHLNEALRCLGQALHTLEDFSAHSNYVELVLREMGMLSIFPHVGVATELVLSNGKRVFPIVTGTFGGVDFLHSVIGEAQDKFTQTELQEMDGVLEEAHNENKKGSSGRHQQSSILKDLLSKIPNCSGMLAEADKLEAAADAREMQNLTIADPSQYGSKAAQQQAGSFDAVKLSQDIYPILQFRDDVVKNLTEFVEAFTESIPGFPDIQDLMDQISDQLSIYVFSVLSPYIRPILAQAQEELKVGSTEVLQSAKNQQFEVWNNAYSTDPTHSMLSKDHFSNVLNSPAGMVATRVVEYTVPRIVLAWENVNADIGLILHDICRVLHHPSLRDPSSEVQMAMFDVVTQWVDSYPGGRMALEQVLNADAVKQGLNHAGGAAGHDCGHGKLRGGEWDRSVKVQKERKTTGGSKPLKKQDTINIGGVKVPLGGLSSGSSSAGLGGALGGALGGIVSASLAGYTEGKPEKSGKDKDKKKEKEKEPKEYKAKEEKYKEEKYREKYKEEKYKEDKDKYKESRYKEGGYKDDKYKDKEKEEKKRREKEKKEKEKDDKKKKEKYHSGGRDYSDDEDSHQSRGKYRDTSPKRYSGSGSHYKSKDYKDYGHKDYGHKHAVDYEYEMHFEKSPEVTSTYGGGGGGGYHHYDEEYDYEYPRPQVAPPTRAEIEEHHRRHLSPYAGHPDEPRHRQRSHSRHGSHSEGRSSSRHKVENEYVEAEYTVPVPMPPMPPHVPHDTPYYYDNPHGVVEGAAVDVEPEVVYGAEAEEDDMYGGHGHKGYGEGWHGGYGKDVGY